MLKRAAEYVAFGFGRPFGVLWAMEKAYFDFRRRFPGKEEHAYLRLALQSRYPEKDSDEVCTLVSDCHNLEDVMVKALSVDLSPGIAAATRMNVLMNLPPCARCGKYRALSTTDDLCYGCRKYPGFSACTHCRLYWDDFPTFCQQCGRELWRITDGPGVPMMELWRLTGGPSVPMIQSGTKSDQSLPVEAGRQASIQQEELAGQEAKEENQFLELAMQAESLAGRCAKVWSESLAERRAYRAARRIDPLAARNMVLATTKSEATEVNLVHDLDAFFDALCDFYLTCSDRNRADIRAVIGSSKRLAGNLHNYVGRSAARLKEAGSPQFLLRGLAATSLDGGHTGQDFDHVLEKLWKNAVEIGSEPAEAFGSVARMSEREIQDMLETFVTSRGPI